MANILAFYFCFQSVLIRTVLWFIVSLTLEHLITNSSLLFRFSLWPDGFVWTSLSICNFIKVSTLSFSLLEYVTFKKLCQLSHIRMNFRMRFWIKYYSLFCQIVLFDVRLGDIFAYRGIYGNGIWILIST